MLARACSCAVLEVKLRYAGVPVGGPRGGPGGGQGQLGGHGWIDPYPVPLSSLESSLTRGETVSMLESTASW